MNRNKLEWLGEELAGLQAAAGHLEYSLLRCLPLIGHAEWSPEQLERLESFTSRFARLADLLMQRIFRLIDELELIGPGTLLDSIFRAEKRGWGMTSDIIKIRELRNLIAHEYADEQMARLHTEVAALTPSLLEIVRKVVSYGNELLRKYPT